MDNSLSLARHFARLVWLLINEPGEKDDQKAQLRAVTTISKEAPARLRAVEGSLMVNDIIIPQALSGVQELADQLVAHQLSALEIDQTAKPSELLAVARLLGSHGENADERHEIAGRIASFEGKTVRFVRVALAPEVAAIVATAVDFSRFDDEPRVRETFERLEAATEPVVAQQQLDELIFHAEQAQRDGRTTAAANLCAALLECEVRVREPEVRRLYLVALRRLTKPSFLRPIARLLHDDPALAAEATEILARFGQDGVDATVDQYFNATSREQRATYLDAVRTLPDSREALLKMLADPRWYVVRQAAILLGELQAADVERPLAELLGHADDRVRRGAVRALNRFDTPFVLDALARALGDAASGVRMAAITAIASRKNARTSALLSKAIDDETETEVQFALLAALGRMASPDAVQKLTRAAEAASGFFKTKKNAALRVGAVYALAEARTPGAMAALQGLLNDKEREVRDAAKAALTVPRGVTPPIGNVAISVP